MSKYLTRDQIVSIIGEFKLPDGFATMSQDSYSEELLAKKIASMKSPPELLACAINLSLVGFGNKKLGQFRTNEVVSNIQTVFRTFQVSFQNEKNAILKEDELTPQRLCRLYRHAIRDYILKTNQSSYLWRKYTSKDDKFKATTFRGAEYLEDLKPQEADYLLSAVRELDDKINSNVAERVIRVFEARGQVYTKT
jgi:hypothetical protein